MSSALEEMMERLEGLSPEKFKTLAEEFQKTPLGKAKWVPTEGPQLMAYESEADLLLYGGQAGGGKSGLIIGWALTRAKRSLVMRRQYTDTKALIDDCLEKNGTRKGYSGQAPARLNTEDKRLIDFGGCKMPGDEQQWQGQPHDFIGIDEATQFEESQVRFLMGWNRSTDPSVKCRVILATNPPIQPGQGQWIVKMFAAWLDPSHPNPAEPGELRWYVTDENGEDLEVDGPEEVEIGGKPTIPQSRTYIPASLKDNPFLDEGYKAKLDNLPKQMREAIRDGNWMIAQEDLEFQVIPTAWILAAQDRWTRNPPDDSPMNSIGIDIALGGVANTVLVPRYGNWFAEPIVVPGRDTPMPSDVAALAFNHRRQDAEIVLDMGGGYGSGVLEKLRNNNIPVYPYDGSKSSAGMTVDRQFNFCNLRSEFWWRLREALDPESETNQPIALPPGAEIVADLAAPTFEIKPAGIQVELKSSIKKRLGHSPDIGDAIVMAWNVGDKYLTHGRIWRDLTRGGSMRPKVKMAYQNRRRRH